MFTPEKWPLVIVSLGLILGAVIDGWKFKVPNKVTFPLIFTGWLLGLYYFPPIHPPNADDTSNRFVASIICTIWACGLLVWVYALGGMGAGDVKLLMGGGAWMGAYFGTSHGMSLIFYSFAVGVVIGGVIGFVMMIPRFQHHLQNMGEIAKEMATSKGNITHIAEKAAQRRPHWLRLPYGVPLTIGIVGYIWLREAHMLPNFLNPVP